MTDSIEENYPGLLEGEVNENELKEGETYYIINRRESTTKPREEGKYKGHKMYVKKEMPYFEIRKAGTDKNPHEGWRHPGVYRFFKRPQDVVLQRQAITALTNEKEEGQPIGVDMQKEIRSYLGGKKRRGKSLKKSLKNNLSKGKKKYSRKTRKGKTKKRRK
uniref:Uncharacterized protein n=1 Tax=viral metagenome TaxID=1070528 RepID=A0A6C0FE88_9ZZZZ|tara:strand:- start:17016 stop:17501 length:486 start_codon:yes stop_codon:yes gene_type:complete